MRDRFDDPIPLNAFREVRQQPAPTLSYLKKLEERLADRGYAPSDPLRRMTIDACDALYALDVQLHTAGCDGTTLDPNRILWCFCPVEPHP